MDCILFSVEFDVLVDTCVLLPCHLVFLSVMEVGSVASGFSGYSRCLCGNSEGSITDKILDEEVSVLFR